MIDVIIITYNRCEELKDVLDSLHHQDGTEYIDYEITVVDNNSSDATRDVIEEFQRLSNENIRYVFEKTQGQAAARNRGIRETKGDIVAFIDDDEIASERWLSVIHKKFSLSDANCLTGKIIPIWNCEKPKWYHENMHGVIGHVDHGNATFILNDEMSGGNMAMRRTLFEQYGGFRLDRGEDAEFSYRVLKKGSCQILYCSEMLVYHKVMPDRLTKDYFRRWSLNSGRISYILEREYGADVTKLFRIPLWAYRRFLKHISGWMKCLIARRIAERFMHETQLYHFFGYVKSVWGGPRY